MAKNDNTRSGGLLKRLAGVKLSTYIILAILALAGLGLWGRSVYFNPQNVFKAALDNNFRSQGVTKTVVQDANQQYMKQDTRLNLGGRPAVLSETTLKQGTGTTVKTESIGTPTTDYVRYTSIKTDQKGTAGNVLDYSPLLNVWGKTANSADATSGQLFNDSTVGVFQFGNLSLSQRKEIIKYIADNNVYKIDYKAVKKEKQSGRPRYVYTVDVDAESLIKTIQKFGKMTGLNNLDELNSSDYAGQERIPFSVTVDVWSQEIVEVKQSGNDQSDIYSGHNASVPVQLPTDAIAVEELQSRLQAIQ